MPHAQSKPRSAGKTKADITMFEITGDPARVFADLHLPAGASVAVIAPNEAVRRTLRKAGFKAYRERPRRPDNQTGAAPALPLPSARYSGPVIDKQAFEPDARARALLRGVKIAEADLREAGGAYNLRDLRTLLRGVSRQRVDKQVREGSLLAVPGPSNRRVYPTIQFQADGTIVKGLKAVREALSTQNPWAVLNFLVQPDDRLNGRKPIELLRTGEIDAVMDVARRVDRQGA
jgi:hypothetical protein